MRNQTLSLLRCPAGCAGELTVSAKETQGDRILNGALTCPTCGQCYPIQDGIARMLPNFLAEATPASESAPDAVEVERKRSEMAARDAQVDAYDKMRGLTLFGKLWEIPNTLKALRMNHGDILLEAGCGTGRMTPTFADNCRSLISVDYSLESLRVCKRKLDASKITNVDLIQADICALPFRDERFTKVVSCGVLEHVPTVESRAKMIAELARVAKVGSDVVVSAYQHNLFTRLFGKKEGAHEGGIYFFRYSRPELQKALAGSLEVRGITGKLVYYYLARCRKTDTAPRPERKATLRFAQRELSLISFGVVLVIVLALGWGLYRMFLSFKSQRDIVIAQSNLLTLWKALQNYAQDWDGRLPPAERWTDSVQGYLSAPSSAPGDKQAALHGPGDGGETLGYVYNTRLAGFNMERPEKEKVGNLGRQPLLIERVDVKPNAAAAIPADDGQEPNATALYKMLIFPHYAGDPDNATTLILYGDGTIRRLKRRDFGQK